MKLILLIVGWLCLWPFGPLHGHGVEGQVAPGGLAVSLQYSSGEAMSFAKVTIVSPTDGRTFQVGHADRHSRCCFYPDTGGDW